MDKLPFVIAIFINSILFGQPNDEGEVGVKFNFVFNDDGAQTKIDQFKFYISNLEIQYEDGSVFHETNSYHLVDVENSASQIILLYPASEKEVESLSYDIGTDSLVNVSGAMDGDLDPVKGMYWAWNSGYINWKLEGSKIMNGNLRKFEFHIGGYLLPTVRRVKHKFGNFQSSSITINVDPWLFLNKVNLKEVNSVLVPGHEASELADMFKTIFSIDE